METSTPSPAPIETKPLPSGTRGKIVIAVAGIFMLVIGIILGAVLFGHSTNSPTPTPTPTASVTSSPTTTTTGTPAAMVDVNLPVVALTTSYGISPSPTTKPPATYKTKLPSQFADQLSAYAVLTESGTPLIFIAPKGWTGNASIGADGYLSADLISSNVDGTQMNSVNIIISSAGTISVLNEAAPYFPWVADNWDQLTPHFEAAPTLEPGITITKSSGHFVNYTKSTNGIETTGMAYTDAQDHQTDQKWKFYGIRVNMDPSQQYFAMALIDAFVTIQGLK